jgi:hypothetical protein
MNINRNHVKCLLRAPIAAQQIAHSCSAFLQLRFSLEIYPLCIFLPSLLPVWTGLRLGLAACHMDPLSVTTSIIAILQLSAKVLKYLNHVEDASKDRVQCEIEILNLVKLKCRVEESSASHLLTRCGDDHVTVRGWFRQQPNNTPPL